MPSRWRRLRAIPGDKSRLELSGRKRSEGGVGMIKKMGWVGFLRDVLPLAEKERKKNSPKGNNKGEKEKSRGGWAELQEKENRPEQNLGGS